MIYSKSRDKEILKFVEEHGSITISICSKVFFANANNKIDLSRKRLRILYKNKYIKRHKEGPTTQVIYYLDKPLTPHRLKLIEVYAELFSIGKVITFIKELEVNYRGHKRRIDGFIELEVETEEYIYSYPVIIEIDMHHNTSLKKMEDIYNSGYFQSKYEMFPTVIIIQRNEWQQKFNTDLFNYSYVKWDLEGLMGVFL